MRNIKFIIGLVALVAASWGLLLWSAEDPSVRGQDPNVETRGLNRGGTPAVATAGSTEPSTGSTSGDGPGADARDSAWSGDAGFVAEAAEIHGRGAALAGLAQRIAPSAAVRDFAGQLQRDHTAAASELEQLAGRKDWAFPESLSTLHREAVDQLRQTARADFNRAYLDETERAIERAVASFRAAEASASDAELKDWAAAQRAALEAHLERARAIER